MKENKNNIYYETLPLYRHRDLYLNNQEFQEHKFFTEKDYMLERYLEDLKYQGIVGSSNIVNPYPTLPQYRYKDRYSTLDHSTIFFKNLSVLMNLRDGCNSYSEYVLKASIRGISQRCVNFELLYIWFARDKFFIFKYWEKDYKPDPMDSYDRWLKYSEMRKEAFKDGHKNCCKYKEFISKTF